jgi:thioredoxin reductase (NADPH)
MLPSLETKDGFVKVDARMHTNIEGVFAAGDCTGKPMQIATAVGEGQVAVLSAVDYLSKE